MSIGEIMNPYYVKYLERCEQSTIPPPKQWRTLITAVLGKWSNLVTESGLDSTVCGRWSRAYLGKGQKKLSIVSVYRVEKHSAPGDATASAQM
jgi:hypothetical protein